MTGRFITLLFVLMTAGACFSQDTINRQHPHPAVVSIFLEPTSSITFNIYDTHLQSVNFKNSTNNAQLLSKRILLDKPSLISYNNVLMLPNAPLFRTYSLLLIPGDTVKLTLDTDKAISMNYSTGYQNFIDSLIAVTKDLSGKDLEEQLRTCLKTKGLNEAVQMIETTYKNSEVSIRNMQLSEIRRYWLRKVNGNIKYAAIAHLLANPSVNRSAVTDSLYDNIYLHLDDIHSINILNNPGIYQTIIAYNAKKQNPDLDKEDLWACIAGADQLLKQTEIYKEYVTNVVAWSFTNTPAEIHEINKSLYKIRQDAPILDTLFQLTDILAETFTNFSLARQKLKSFANGRYSFIIEKDELSANHERKTIKNLPVVTMYDFAGQSYNFKHIVMNKKYKYTLVDFWASWCIPCIAEIPKLKNIEAKMKGRPIQFVTISIDEDNKTEEWINAAKSNNIFGRPSQYRLANFKQSPLTRLINLRTIPRFLMIDHNGNILDEDFQRPGNPRFLLELLKYLN